MKDNKQKLKRIYRIFTAIFILLFIMITSPPIVGAFDRTDIWIGPFPLSQFYVFIIPIAAAIAMAVLYFFDCRYSGTGDGQKERGEAE